MTDGRAEYQGGKTSMALQFATFEEEPELVERYLEDEKDFWGESMEFIYHDPVCQHNWPRLESEFRALQFIAYDNDSDALLARANTIPFSWAGNDDALPDGVDEVLPLAFRQREEGVEPNTLCALLAGIQPGVRAKGLSSKLLEHMKVLARRAGLVALVAPVRPNLKHRYPITPIERYVEWRRDDGLMFDPWLRTHERLGARYAGICRNSNVFRGTVAEWEEWTGIAFPESGEYVIPGAMNPVEIDRQRDKGVLREPNAWMVHTSRARFSQ
jgi:hypothetical protein